MPTLNYTRADGGCEFCTAESALLRCKAAACTWLIFRLRLVCCHEACYFARLPRKISVLEDLLIRTLVSMRQRYKKEPTSSFDGVSRLRESASERERENQLWRKKAKKSTETNLSAWPLRTMSKSARTGFNHDRSQSPSHREMDKKSHTRAQTDTSDWRKRLGGAKMGQSRLAAVLARPSTCLEIRPQLAALKFSQVFKTGFFYNYEQAELKPRHL